MIIGRPYRNFELCLLAWDIVEPFWLKNELQSIDRHALTRAYNDTWIRKGARGLSIFIAGAITFDNRRDAVSFVNGRHRTNLLLLYRRTVPVAVDRTILDHTILRSAVLQQNNLGIEADLPDLPVVQYRNFLPVPCRFRT